MVSDGVMTVRSGEGREVMVVADVVGTDDATVGADVDVDSLGSAGTKVEEVGDEEGGVKPAGAVVSAEEAVGSAERVVVVQPAARLHTTNPATHCRAVASHVMESVRPFP